MSTDVAALYQRVVLEHARHPRNRRAIDGGCRAEGYNPICGDRVTVHLLVDRDLIRDVSFEESACAIVKASASLMTESVQGRTLADARALVERVHQMIAAPPGAPVDDLGALSALAGVRLFPTRMKCAILPWRALLEAADARGGVVSTE